MRPVNIKDLQLLLKTHRQSRVAHAPTKNGMAAKDWITLTISLLAFFISGLSVYWNIIRQVDDLRLLIYGGTYTDIDPVSKKLQIHSGNISLMFINLGNRPVAVTDIFLRSTNQKEMTECARPNLFRLN
jgi:hypothetical protein